MVRAAGYPKTIIIDTEDRQLCSSSNKVPGCVLIKRKNEYVDAQSLCNQEMIDSIIPLHIITVFR